MKDTTENNKLIAEFIGYKVDENLFGGISVNGMKTITAEADRLKYHTSWDWLMPVVEKCLIGEAEQSPEISNTTIKNIYEALCNTEIKEVYNSVIEFIKWYNKNAAERKQ